MKTATTFSLLAVIAAQTAWASPDKPAQSVNVETRDEPVIPLLPDWYRCDSRDISPMKNDLVRAAAEFWDRAYETCDRPGEVDPTQMYNHSGVRIVVGGNTGSFRCDQVALAIEVLNMECLSDTGRVGGVVRLIEQDDIWIAVGREQ